MGEFSASWLALREPFDHAARSRSLVQALGLSGAVRVLELGAGTGSGVRWLRSHLPEASFTLVDHDPDLLVHAGREGTAHRHDLDDLAGLDLPADLVSCQALLDLVSHDWLVRFADWLVARGVPLLATLTVDGRVIWSPEDPEDARVQQAFRDHQLTDRGFGASPGTQAAQVLAELLRQRGYTVRLEQADWVIPSDARAMLEAMVDGTAQASGEMLGEGEVAAWRARRLADAREGRLGLRVGHLDLLATPG